MAGKMTFTNSPKTAPPAWHSAGQVIIDLVLGVMAGLLMSVIISFGFMLLEFFLSESDTDYLLYAMHFPIYYFLAQRFSERPAFRAAFTGAAIFVVILMTIMIYSNRDIAG